MGAKDGAKTDGTDNKPAAKALAQKGGKGSSKGGEKEEGDDKEWSKKGGDKDAKEGGDDKEWSKKGGDKDAKKGGDDKEGGDKESSGEKGGDDKESSGEKGGDKEAPASKALIQKGGKGSSKGGED